MLGVDVREQYCRVAIQPYGFLRDEEGISLFNEREDPQDVAVKQCGNRGDERPAIDGMERLPALGPDGHDDVMAICLGDHMRNETGIQVGHICGTDKAVLGISGHKGRIDASQRTATRSDVFCYMEVFQSFTYMSYKDNLMEEWLYGINHMLYQRLALELRENLIAAESFGFTANEYNPGHEKVLYGSGTYTVKYKV
jgi:hypothetical protein